MELRSEYSVEIYKDDVMIAQDDNAAACDHSALECERWANQIIEREEKLGNKVVINYVGKCGDFVEYVFTYYSTDEGYDQDPTNRVYYD